MQLNMETVYFLCGNLKKTNFVYAIKNDRSDWHYFEEVDSLHDVHASLPSDLGNKISRLNKVKPIALTLNADQLLTYVNEDKFVFNGKELKTYIQLSGKTAIQRGLRNQSHPSKNTESKSAYNMVFEAGKANPTIFLKEYEKCSDIKTEKDKLYKLRDFVNENDKREFSTLFFKNDWPTARSTFLKKYSLEFTENKRRELCFRFEEETSLRSFVARKMNAMNTYTILPVVNQLEIILSELPTGIANFFIVEDKLNSTKGEILEFCDLIQEYCEDIHTTNKTTLTSYPDVPSTSVQDLEIFNFQEGVESLSDTGSTGSTDSTLTNSSGGSKIKKMRRSGRLVKIPRTITEEIGTSTDSDSNQMDK